MAAQKLVRPRPRKKRPTVRIMPWLTIDDMAQALGVCHETIYRYIREGIIPATRTATKGGRTPWKIEREWALAYLRGEEGHVPIGRNRRAKLKPADPRQLVLYP